MKKSFVSILASLGLVMATPSVAQKQYDPGASDSEIKIGQTQAYSGPASAYGTIGKMQAAYFKMINEQGGINGRKITFLSLDDGYSPPKTVEMTRRLVEQDQVLFLFNQLGTPTNSAVHKYLNAKKVPQLFVATGASKWNDPKNFPWTLGFNPNYHSEGKLYGQHVLKNKPGAKIAILYQNDDYGKDYLKGFKEGLGDKAKSLVVGEVSYEVTDPTIDSQMLTLKNSGADTFMNITTPKFAAQAIRKAADIGWKPLHYLNQVSGSVGSVLTPAGLDNAKDIISMAYIKDPTDAKFANDPAIKDYQSFMKKYFPEGDPSDANNTYGMAAAQLLVQVLKACGDNLTRENVMKVATSLKDVQIPLALPGVTASTSPDDFATYQIMQLQRFDGKQWQLIGEPVSVR
jgi:branched-chain amino acid transport system substrate-binding protein